LRAFKDRLEIFELRKLTEVINPEKKAGPAAEINGACAMAATLATY
jgi:hypothetical protein